MNRKKRKLLESKKQKSVKKSSHKILFNILTIPVLLILFNLLVSRNNGYKWMWNTLVIKNLEFIKKNKGLSITEKHEAKQGFFFRYLNFININTPENAIILMPPDSIIDLVDPKYNLKTLKDRRKTTYFIYPRKAVYEKNNKYDSIYMDSITHIAIVNYYGYEKLNYNIRQESKQQFSIIPLSTVDKK